MPHLSQLRRDAGLDQQQLADRIGRDQSFISRLEAGEKRASRETIERLAGALGVSVRDINIEVRES